MNINFVLTHTNTNASRVRNFFERFFVWKIFERYKNFDTELLILNLNFFLKFVNNTSILN
jgi:hypothetical protein